MNSHYKDKLANSSVSLYPYYFNCCCRAYYGGPTTRQMHYRIFKHHASWLTIGQNKVIKISILAYLVDTTNNHSDNTMLVIYNN